MSSEGKWIIFENHTIEKLEEIIKDLKEDIEKVSKEDTSKYSRDYPYECLLEELEQLLTQHKRECLYSDYMMCVDDIEEYTFKDHIDKVFPKEKHIFKRTPYEQSNGVTHGLFRRLETDDFRKFLISRGEMKEHYEYEVMSYLTNHILKKDKSDWKGELGYSHLGLLTI